MNENETIADIRKEAEGAIPDVHRFNAEKLGMPFYVDVGTSIVAVRCTCNHEVVWRADHAWSGRGLIDEARRICATMNQAAKHPIGNAAKLREALEAARDLILPQCNGGTAFAKACGEVVNKIMSALAERPEPAKEGGE